MNLPVPSILQIPAGSFPPDPLPSLHHRSLHHWNRMHRTVPRHQLSLPKTHGHSPANSYYRISFRPPLNSCILLHNHDQHSSSIHLLSKDIHPDPIQPCLTDQHHLYAVLLRKSLSFCRLRPRRS